MADNYETDAGSGGVVFASDEDGSTVHWPYVKLAWGSDNTQTIVDTSNPIPVDLRTDNLSGNIDVNIAAQTSDITIADGGNVITVDGTVAVSGTVTTTDAAIYVDDADWTATSSSHALIGGIYQSSPGTITDGDTGPLRLTSNGAAHISIQEGGPTQYAVDAALGGTPTGNLALAIRDDALSSLSPVEGDAIGLRVDANGGLWVTSSGTVTVDNGGTFAVQAAQSGTWNIQDIGGTVSLPTGAATAALQTTGNTALSAIQTAVEGALDVSAATVTVDLGANNDVVASGDVAHDTADSGNPVKIGAVARTAHPTAVAGADRVNVYADDLGRLVTYPYAPRDLLVHNRLALTSDTETTLIAAGGAGVIHDLVWMSFSNESASEVRVDIRDDTAGTVRFSIDLAADGGGAIVALPVPLTASADNDNWTAQLSSSVSTVYITAIAIKQN